MFGVLKAKPIKGPTEGAILLSQVTCPGVLCS